MEPMVAGERAVDDLADQSWIDPLCAAGHLTRSRLVIGGGVAAQRRELLREVA